MALQPVAFGARELLELKKEYLYCVVLLAGIVIVIIIAIIEMGPLFQVVAFASTVLITKWCGHLHLVHFSLLMDAPASDTRTGSAGRPFVRPPQAAQRPQQQHTHSDASCSHLEGGGAHDTNQPAATLPPPPPVGLSLSLCPSHARPHALDCR